MENPRGGDQVNVNRGNTTIVVNSGSGGVAPPAQIVCPVCGRNRTTDEIGLTFNCRKCKRPNVCLHSADAPRCQHPGTRLCRTCFIDETKSSIDRDIQLGHFDRADKRVVDWLAYIDEYGPLDLDEREELEEYRNRVADERRKTNERTRAERIAVAQKSVTVALTNAELEAAARAIEALSALVGAESSEIALARRRLTELERESAERQRFDDLLRLRQSAEAALGDGDPQAARRFLEEFKRIGAGGADATALEALVTRAEAKAIKARELDRLRNEAKLLQKRMSQSPITVTDAMSALGALVTTARAIKRLLDDDSTGEFDEWDGLQRWAEVERMRLENQSHRIESLRVKTAEDQQKKAEEERQRELSARNEQLEALLSVNLGAAADVSSTIRFVAVPQAVARIGAPDEDAWARPNERPAAEVLLTSYGMGVFPVTVVQFHLFVRATGYKTSAEIEGHGLVWNNGRWDQVTGAFWAKPLGPSSDVARKAHHPVTQVSWDDAVAFCGWLSETSRRKARLPTEAEWEFAARGPERRVWHWGDAQPGADNCNYGDLVGGTTKLRQYEAAGYFGTLDQSGNVWEWTSSVFTDFPYRNDDQHESKTSRAARVLRGGSYLSRAEECRCSYRHMNLPSFRSCAIGFRVRIDM